MYRTRNFHLLGGKRDECCKPSLKNKLLNAAISRTVQNGPSSPPAFSRREDLLVGFTLRFIVWLGFVWLAGLVWFFPSAVSLDRWLWTSRAVQSTFNPPFAGADLPEQAAPRLVRGESVMAMLIPTLQVELQYKMMLLLGLM